MSNLLKIEDFDNKFFENLKNIVFRVDSIHQVVNSILTNNRSGTVGQKNRALVKGGGKKPWRQKGTGRARAGTRTSPLWRGGGVVFGSSNSNKKYSHKINKKFYKMAFLSLFAEMMRRDIIKIIFDFGLGDKISTKRAQIKLNEFGLHGRVLIIKEEGIEDLSLRNIKNISLIDINKINPYILSLYDFVIFDNASFTIIKERLGYE